MYQNRSSQNSDENYQRGCQRQQRQNCIGYARCFPLIFLRQQLGIDRDERGGERAFAENVLQKVWNSERSVECARRVRDAEVVRENSLADEADDTAQENASADQESMLSCARLLLALRSL